MDHDRIMAYQVGKSLRYNVVALLIGEKQHGRDNSVHSAVTLKMMFSSTVLTPFKENDINYSIVHWLILFDFHGPESEVERKQYNFECFFSSNLLG